VGLERAGFSPDDLALVRRVFKAFYREGLNRKQAAEKLRCDVEIDHAIVQAFLKFAAGSGRGLS
jgi:UDP-N-acetylglucosamine acyltransferase